MFHIEERLELLKLCTQHFASMLQYTFLPTDRITTIFFCKSNAIICCHAWSTLLKTELL